MPSHTNIVIANYNKDTTFILKLREPTYVIVYEKEKPDAKYNIPVNKGNEASAYLKYILDFYDDMTEYTYFIHDEEYAWHHTGSVIDKFYEARASNKLYYNINDKCVLGSIVTNEWYYKILLWYNKYINKYIPLSALPNKDWTDGHRGSAQFLVHRDIIRKLPKQFYQDLYDWIITTNLTSNESGRYLEWTWHLLWDIYPNQILQTKVVLK